MIQKRAQTATEYLIILAVVIIIALIVVGVLGGIPGIGSSTGSSTNSARWQTAEIGIDSLAAVASAADTIVIRNNKPNSITINAIQTGTTTALRDADIDMINGSSTTALTKGNTNSAAGTYTIPAGGTLTLNGSIDTACSSGDAVTLYFRFNYTDSATGGSYEYTNSDAAYETTCAAS